MLAATRVDARLTICAAGELDHHRAATFSDEVRDLLEPHDREVCLDLSEITSCGTAGVIAILGVRHYIRSQGCDFVVNEPSGAVHGALQRARCSTI